MSHPTNDTWLHSIIESIDRRLELLNSKVDNALANITTKAYCQNECDIRKNSIDKRYFLGWGSAMVLMSAAIGVVLKFL
ncbi:MAG: hypothetical protein HYY29_03735 [Chloroflexi bacterium]|nr:hypothetical protein [Chloroflexota bacterium]